MSSVACDLAQHEWEFPAHFWDYHDNSPPTMKQVSSPMRGISNESHQVILSSCHLIVLSSCGLIVVQNKNVAMNDGEK
jgi:hypothetical protein